MRLTRGKPRKARPRRVAVVAYTHYETDGRVRREAEALASAGYEVTAIVLGDERDPTLSELAGVSIYSVRLPIRRGSRVRYLYQYGMFLVLSSAVLLGFHLRKPFSLVHVHSLPDFEIFCALPVKLLGTTCLLDLHEAMPEIVAARFRLPMNSMTVRFAALAEHVSCRIANHVIAANDGIRSAVLGRGISPSHVTSVYNGVDSVPKLPPPSGIRRMFGLPDVRLIVHAGGVNQERDLETLLTAVSMLPDSLACGVVIAGDGPAEYLSTLRALADSLGLASRTWFLGQLTHDMALSVLSLSEVGVVTLVSNPLTRLAWPNRIMEYVLLQKRLVLPDLPFLASVMGGAAKYYVPGDPISLARRLEETLTPTEPDWFDSTLAEDAIAPLNWPKMRAVLLDVCQQVVGTLGRSRATGK